MGVGDGGGRGRGAGGTCPPKFGKFFSGNYVKFGHFWAKIM